MEYPCDQCSSWWAVFLRPASRRSREFSPSKPQTPYLRVDRTEQTIVAWSALSHPLGPVGYAVAYELAQEQLQLHLDVIVECVNPIARRAILGPKSLPKTARRFLKWRLSARMNPSIGAVSRLAPRMSKG